MKSTYTIRDAIAITTAWITASDLPFSAAFIGGSVAHADDDAPHEPTSDVDCYLVVQGDPPEGKIGKITVDGLLLDVSWIPWSALENAENDAVLASLLNFGRVVKDDGELGPLQKGIRGAFSNPDAIATRLESMRSKIRNGLSRDSSHLPMPEQVMNWLFPATLATHIPLIAACRPLTVRKRFLAAREVMDAGEYEGLLALYGFDTVSRHQAQQWLDTTTRLFDATTGIAEQSDRFWATDIRVDARHIAIDGSQNLIDAGDHREALYWIIATGARCLTVRNDADINSDEFLGEFKQMLRPMDLDTVLTRRTRSDDILRWIESDHPSY